MFTKYMIFFWKDIKRELFFLIVVRLLNSISPVIQLIITKNLIDSLSIYFQTGGKERLHESFLYLFIQSSILISNNLISMFERINNSKMQIKINYNVEEKIIKKSSNIPLYNYDRGNFYDQLLRASSGQSQRVVEILNGPMLFVQYLITLMTLVGILLKFHYFTLITCLILSIPPLMLNLYLSKARYKLVKELTPLSRKVNYLLNILKSKEYAKEIRIFQLQDYFIERWRKNFQISSKIQLTFDYKSSLTQNLLNCICVVVIALNLALFVFIGPEQKLSIGEYLTISQAFITVQGILLSIALSISGSYENFIQLSDLIEFLEIPEDKDTNEESVDTIPIVRKLSVNNLSYSYEGNSQFTLKNISFCLERGQRVAIVGKNGAGKSTLVKCLLGLYKNYSGTILYGATDLKTISQKALHKHVSAIFQDFSKYNFSIIENIAVGEISKIEDLQQIKSAAKKSGASDFIEKLPMGYSTGLGSMFDKGVELSGGQWQKVALSRAYFSEAEIIVLDEPAASLDPYAEADLYQNFSDLSEDRITIMISHRLNSCVNADVILVMDNGMIIEQGSHDELIRLKGIYTEMYSLQSKNFN
ncbi:ABC transporter ATP-binding protein [Paenibacillus tritici]|uniref:ABC transporter ATP-binding protein n=1 Tax=Paenibacillus tritici TaxID=1873425 RepID=A0ABX2DMX6_9BACL|nr:ABC transporter ATP-binding protein [Paenibacillus tritici]NQX45454.1 ABC transporter ATP-binding protein [Paenibacillus tritici]